MDGWMDGWIQTFFRIVCIKHLNSGEFFQMNKDNKSYKTLLVGLFVRKFKTATDPF